MVACPKCVVNNTLDSGFCKKCGAVLPVSVIEEEQEKLKEIVTKGMESYESGNLEEAMAIAEHSILTNPSYGEAYALKGLVHERKAEYAEALDAYETVVAINPDSTIDKIKLNQLRNAFAQRQSGSPKPDRRGAALMGLAATLLFASVGGVVYGIVQSSSETKQTTQSSNLPVSNQQNVSADTNTAHESTNIPLANNGNGNSGYLGPGDVPALGGNQDQTKVADTTPHTGSGRRGGGGGNFDSTGTYQIEPAGPGLPDPNGPIGAGQKTQQNPTHNQGGNKIVDPPVDENRGNGNSGGGNQGSQTEKDPPVKAASETYDISFSNGKKDGGITNSDSGNRNSGGGKSFQRQGQTLQRSGKTSQARDAYEKAISAYEQEISSGKGDKEAAQAGLNSCKQALKNLKD